jgi:soluble lytic murein transglycosylase-like protein
LSAAELPVADEAAGLADEAPPVSLEPRLSAAMDYVSRRYKVSAEAVQPIFATAQAVGHELHIDPLLIIAIIGVESSFNPFSQSGFGAQGLMQVVPRFHQDKLPEEASFLDPVTNVQVGARVLKEYIHRHGGLEEGLQQFGGALNDAGRRYAGKVLAERQRLEQAVQRVRSA